MNADDIYKIDDWRIMGQPGYLYKVKLKKLQFQKSRFQIDHVHCEFCWDKFSEAANDLHEGYTTMDEKYWICETCFLDFHKIFPRIVK